MSEEATVQALAKELLIACSTARWDEASILLSKLVGTCRSQDQLLKLAVNIAEPYGSTPLLLAAKYGQVVFVKELLAQGAAYDVVVRPSGNTPLHLASLMGHIEVLKCLLDSGSDVNARNAGGDTPLMFACGSAHLGAAARLLKAGANLTFCNASGLTPLMVASSAGHELIIKALLRAKDQQHRIREIVVVNGQEVEQDMGAASLVDMVDQQGNTALHYAARAGHVAVVRALLDSGADTSLRNSNGRTALGEAQLAKCKECTDMLLAHSQSSNAVLDIDSPKAHVIDTAAADKSSKASASTSTSNKQAQESGEKRSKDGNADGSVRTASENDSKASSATGKATVEPSSALEISQQHVSTKHHGGQQPFQTAVQQVEDKSLTGDVAWSLVAHKRKDYNASTSPSDPKSKTASYSQGSSVKARKDMSAATPLQQKAQTQQHKKSEKVQRSSETTQRSSEDEKQQPAERAAAVSPASDGPWRRVVQQGRAGHGSASLSSSNNHKHFQSIETEHCSNHTDKSQPSTCSNNTAQGKQPGLESLQISDRWTGNENPKLQAPSPASNPGQTTPAVQEEQTKECSARRRSTSSTGSVGCSSCDWLSDATAMLESCCPQATALNILPCHVLGLGLDTLSFSQLEALEQVHLQAVTKLGELKLTLARRQERARVTEATKVRLMLASRQAALAAAALEDEAGEDDRE